MISDFTVLTGQISPVRAYLPHPELPGGYSNQLVEIRRIVDFPLGDLRTGDYVGPDPVDYMKLPEVFPFPLLETVFHSVLLGNREPGGIQGEHALNLNERFSKLPIEIMKIRSNHRRPHVSAQYPEGRNVPYITHSAGEPYVSNGSSRGIVVEHFYYHGLYYVVKAQRRPSPP